LGSSTVVIPVKGSSRSHFILRRGGEVAGPRFPRHHARKYAVPVDQRAHQRRSEVGKECREQQKPCALSATRRRGLRHAAGSAAIPAAHSPRSDSVPPTAFASRRAARRTSARTERHAMHVPRNAATPACPGATAGAWLSSRFTRRIATRIRIRIPSGR